MINIQGHYAYTVGRPRWNDDKLRARFPLVMLAGRWGKRIGAMALLHRAEDQSFGIRLEGKFPKRIDASLNYAGTGAVLQTLRSIEQATSQWFGHVPWHDHHLYIALQMKKGEEVVRFPSFIFERGDVNRSPSFFRYLFNYASLECIAAMARKDFLLPLNDETFGLLPHTGFWPLVLDGKIDKVCVGKDPHGDSILNLVTLAFKCPRAIEIATGRPREGLLELFREKAPRMFQEYRVSCHHMFDSPGDSSVRGEA